MPVVVPNFIVHKLNVDLLFSPKKQKPRRSAKQHVEIMKEKVEKLNKLGLLKRYSSRNGYQIRT